MPYVGDPSDFRTMAAAMQSLAGNPAGMRPAGQAPMPQLTGSGPITPPQTTRGSMTNAAVGSTGGDMTNTGNETGGGATQQLAMLVQQLTQMLGRPPTQEEIGAYLQQLQGPHPGAVGAQVPSGMPPVPVTPPPTYLRRP